MAFAGAAAAPAAAETIQRLNYESGNLRQWTAVQALPGRASVVRRPVTQGRFAARFVVRPGDDPINSSGERSEVLATTGETEGVESWWSWATLFPRTFRANEGAWNVFTQWHHTGPTCPPPLSFVVSKEGPTSRLVLRVRGGSLPSDCEPAWQRDWTLGGLRRGRWYRFRFHVRWSADAGNGFVEVWVNGRRRVPRTSAPTLYPGQGVYVKQGFYRGPGSTSSVVFHDGMRRYRP
jgi:hypothetical protein